jgi:hypothetical protein
MKPCAGPAATLGKPTALALLAAATTAETQTTATMATVIRLMLI